MCAQTLTFNIPVASELDCEVEEARKSFITDKENCVFSRQFHRTWFSSLEVGEREGERVCDKQHTTIMEPMWEQNNHIAHQVKYER